MMIGVSSSWLSRLSSRSVAMPSRFGIITSRNLLEDRPYFAPGHGRILGQQYALLSGAVGAVLHPILLEEAIGVFIADGPLAGPLSFHFAAHALRNAPRWTGRNALPTPYRPAAVG